MSTDHIAIAKGKRGKGPRTKRAVRALRLKGGPIRPAGYWYAKGERRPEPQDSQ